MIISEKNRILYYVAYVVFKRKLTLALLAMVTFSLIVFFTFLATPLYRASTMILIRPNPQQQLILFKDLATPGEEIGRVNPAANLIHILTSQQMAQEVVEQFKLDQRLREKKKESGEIRTVIKDTLIGILTYPLKILRNIVGGEKKPPDYFSKAVENLLKEGEDIQLEADTNVINLAIWESEPQLAANIANYMASRLIQKSAQMEQMNADQAFDFTGRQVADAENALAESERELWEYREKNNIVDLEQEKNAKLASLNLLEAEHINVKTRHLEAQAKLQEIRNTISIQKELLSKAPILTNNPVVKELIDSLNTGDIELAVALETYTEASENVKRLRAKALESRKKIEKELHSVMQNDSAVLQSIHPELASEYAQLRGDVAALAAKKDALKNEIDAIRAEALFLSGMETHLESLNRRKTTKEKLYTELLNKFSQLKVQKVSQMSGYDLKIIDKAFLPENARPRRPNWAMTIVFSFVASIFLGLGIVFSIEYWDESFKSPKEIEERIGLPVLCTVPDMD